MSSRLTGLQYGLILSFISLREMTDEKDRQPLYLLAHPHQSTQLCSLLGLSQGREVLIRALLHTHLGREGDSLIVFNLAFCYVLCGAPCHQDSGVEALGQVKHQQQGPALQGGARGPAYITLEQLGLMSLKQIRAIPVSLLDV